MFSASPVYSLILVCVIRIMSTCKNEKKMQILVDKTDLHCSSTFVHITLLLVDIASYLGFGRPEWGYIF